MVTETKFCVDCRYYRSMFNNSCTSPNNGRSLITGEILFKPAEFNRSRSDRCGVEGSWFTKQTDKEKFYSTFRYVPENL